jgi:hypothetical protein
MNFPQIVIKSAIDIFMDGDDLKWHWVMRAYASETITDLKA